MNHTTRRFPRSLQEAFGPYTSNEIIEEDEFTFAETLSIVIGVVSGFILAGAFIICGL